MSATIIRGNALDLPLADASVDLVVTSPPYFGLRSYQDGGEHYRGQIGAEPTPAEFVDALIAATREMVRVLKPSGSIWVNLGDKYCADNRGSGADHKRGAAKWAPAGKAGYPGEGIIKQKSLIGIPWRYALRCIDDIGLILRAEVIWAKPNGLPESVTDRVRRSHEVWFHFTKEPRYYSAVDEIREAQKPESIAHREKYPRAQYNGGRMAETGMRMTIDNNPLGKLPGSVWTIPTQPLKVPPELGIDHFAAFPMEFPRRIIAGWSPAGVCTACGQGRRPVAVRASMESRRPGAHKEYPAHHAGHETRTLDVIPDYRITGYACDCATPTVQVELVNRDRRTGELVTHVVDRPVENWVNPAPTTPGVVLDPFGGTGTTALVADVMGRRGISVDMSADYCRLAAWRTNDPKQRERAARGPKQAAKPKPPEKLAEVEFIHPDQLDLFEDGAA